MNAATQQEVDEMTAEFKKMVSEGTGELKAAYLVASEKGFTTVIKNSRDSVFLLREKDNTFIVCSYPGIEVPEQAFKIVKAVRFHTDKTIFNF